LGVLTNSEYVLEYNESPVAFRNITISTSTLFYLMNKLTINVALSLITIAGLLMFQGCSGNSLGTVKVSGTVTLDGKPAEGVTVEFYPVGEGRECFGVTDAQGKFVLTVSGADIGSGAIPGEYHVILTKMRDVAAEMLAQLGNSSDPDSHVAIRGGLPEPVNMLPEKYADRTATDIAPVTVERRGKNSFTFELRSQ